MDAFCRHGCIVSTPYSVKIRYPQELNIEEYHVSKALVDMKIIYDFVANKIKELP